MVQEFDLYVVSAYHPEHGLQSYVASIEENADWVISQKQDRGWITHKRGLIMGDYGFPGQMKAGMITKEDVNRKPIIIGVLTAEQLGEIKKALEEYEHKPDIVPVGTFEYVFYRDELNNCEGRRVTLESALDRIYRILRGKSGSTNNNDMLLSILRICKEVIDPTVLEDLDR